MPQAGAATGPPSTSSTTPSPTPVRAATPEIIADPRMPYFPGGVLMEAPGVGTASGDNFTYQARAFVDQVAGIAEPLPACATFADALRTMEIVQPVVESSRDDGAAVAVPGGVLGVRPSPAYRTWSSRAVPQDSSRSSASVKVRSCRQAV